MHCTAYLFLAGAVLPQLGATLPDASSDATRVDTTRVVYVRGGIPEGANGTLGNRFMTLTEFTETKTVPYGQLGQTPDHVTMVCRVASNFVPIIHNGCAGLGGGNITITASGSTFTVTVPSQDTASLGPGPSIFTSIGSSPDPTHGGDGGDDGVTEEPFPTDDNGPAPIATATDIVSSDGPSSSSGPSSSALTSSSVSSSSVSDSYGSSFTPSSSSLGSSSAPSSSASLRLAPSGSGSSSVPSSSEPASPAPSSSTPSSSTSSGRPPSDPAPSSSVPSTFAPSSSVPLSSTPSSSAPSSSGPSSSALSSVLSSSSPAPSSSPSSSALSSSAPSSSAPSNSASSPTPSIPPPSILAPPSASSKPASSSSSKTSSSSPPGPPGPSCTDLSNGAFVNGVLRPWYLSDQLTSNSKVVAGGPPGGSGYAFEMIPSQSDSGQVYLNQLLPSCGQPPPAVTVHISFRYMFSGSAGGCSIGSKINQDGASLLSITDSSGTPGTWYTYSGPATNVQLSYNPIFTLMMKCAGNTANIGSIFVSDISVY